MYRHILAWKNPVALMPTGFSFNFVLYVVWFPLVEELRNHNELSESAGAARH
jgi:hypothetical protein